MKPGSSKDPQASFQLALSDHQKGRLAEAEQAYRAILRQWPQHADSLNLLGVVLCQTSRAQEGTELIERAVRLRRAPQYLLNLGLAFQTLGDRGKAIEAIAQAVALDPKTADGHFTLAQLLEQERRFDQALAAYLGGLAVAPATPGMWVRVGGVLEELGRTGEAIAAYRIETERDAANVDALVRIAALLHDQGREDEATALYDRAVALRPDSLDLAWRLTCSRLKLLYASEAEIMQARSAYEAGLRDVAGRIAAASPEQLAPLAPNVGISQPFYLPYQGHDDVELQRVYGAMICRIMQAAHPDFAGKPPMPEVGEKIRIGFVSGYFSRHSNWKIPIKGWAQNLDRTRFETFAYHLGKRRDDETEVARKSFDSFVEARMSVAEWAQRIRDDRLHVLIFPETGMDQMTVRLAALRLAPVQAVSWGHPNTSGMPTIDYFLSSDLMEAEGADAFYSEKLVRLPNISVHYQPPYAPTVDEPREKIGVPKDAIVYWCCQSLFKYLPQHDDLFPRIARRVPNARFLFIGYGRGQRVTERLQERLTKAFLRHGLSAQRHCVFLPQMDLIRFNAIARASDVFLDTIGWSACNSLLEALMFDLPPVALDGAFMRGRHASAILRMIGLDDLIARDADDYVERAVRLGSDPALRAQTRARIAAHKQRALGDLACVRGLEEFFETAVRAAHDASD